MIRADILQKISQQMAIDVDNWCDKYWADKFRNHLGASVIGEDCQRKLWYNFRWIVKPEFEPRVKRLLDRGQREEERIVEYLRGIGCTVNQFDLSYRLLLEPTNNDYVVVNIEDNMYNELDSMGAVDVSEDYHHVICAFKKGIKYPVQWSVSDIEGHFGGSCDGKGFLPTRYGIDEEILFEFKTANEKSFNSLVKNGMQADKPLHYAQCCTYGYLMKINYVCYVCACKNDDRLYFEILPLNHKTGEMQVLKADRIIKSVEPLPRLFENPTYWICKACDCFPVCHGNAEPEKNCRSCKWSEPAKGKQWVCNKHKQIITDEIMPNHYECWESICQKS